MMHTLVLYYQLYICRLVLLFIIPWMALMVVQQQKTLLTLKSMAQTLPMLMVML